jgi:hypothetical protein
MDKARKNRGTPIFVVWVPGTVDPRTGRKDLFPRYRAIVGEGWHQDMPRDQRQVLVHFNTDNRISKRKFKERKEAKKAGIDLYVDPRIPRNLLWKQSKWTLSYPNLDLEMERLRKGTQKASRAEFRNTIAKDRPGKGGRGREVTAEQTAQREAQRENVVRRQDATVRRQEAEAKAKAAEKRALQIRNIKKTIATLNTRKNHAEQQVMKGVRVDHWAGQRDKLIEAIAVEEAKLHAMGAE